MTEDTFAVDDSAVAWRETGDEIVILDLTGSVYFGLNGTGAQLWKRLIGGASRADLAAVLTSAGSAPDPSAEVDQFLAALDDYGLLQKQ